MVQIVKYTKGKKKFEVMTKDGSVRKFRDGKLGWNNVLMTDMVFINHKKGDVAKKSDLIEVFGTDNLETCLQIIVKEGELQVNATERKEDMDNHRRKVLAYLHKAYIDECGRPRPLMFLESILDNSKVKITVGDHLVQKQAEELVKELQGTLVFKKSTKEYTIVLTHQHAKKCQGIIYKYGSSVREKWNEKGCTYTFEVSPFDFDMLVEGLNKISDGDFELYIDGNKPSTENENNSKKGRGKSKKGKGKNK